MYTYNHKCFLYYNGSIDKGSIINRTDGKKYFTFHLSDFLILIKMQLSQESTLTIRTKGDNAPINNVILNTFDLKE